MPNHGVKEFIEQLPFFNEFSDSEKIKLVKTTGIFEKFKIDETIIKEGDTDSSVYVILTGTVKIKKSPKAHISEGAMSLHDPEELTIAELKAGSIFGEISLITQSPRKNSAVASSEQVVVMKITNEVFEQFHLAMQKNFQSQLIKILVQRLNEMNEKYIKLKTS